MNRDRGRISVDVTCDFDMYGAEREAKAQRLSEKVMAELCETEFANAPKGTPKSFLKMQGASFTGEFSDKDAKAVIADAEKVDDKAVIKFGYAHCCRLMVYAERCWNDEICRTSGSRAMGHPVADMHKPAFDRMLKVRYAFWEAERRIFNVTPEPEEHHGF